MKLFTLTFLAATFFCLSARAQMVDCNVFMQGHYVELGIAPNGAYGSTVGAPPGYHPNVTQFFYSCEGTTSDGYMLGFVADPDEDGWDAGTPAYYGDFYMPGTPQEGWAMQIGNTEINAYMPNYESSLGAFTAGPDHGGSLPAGLSIAGSNISYSDSAGVITAVWQGMWSGIDHYNVDTTYTTIDTALITLVDVDTVIDGTFVILIDTVVIDTTMTLAHYDTLSTVYDSILITQTTTLDTEAIYFITQVTFTNLSDSPVSNVFYMRTLDPDNDEAEGGSYTTSNTWNLSSFPSATAKGTVFPSAYLALGTGDTTATAFQCDAGLFPEGIASSYWSSILSGGSGTYDVGIGLVFNLGTIPGAISSGGGKLTSGALNSKTIKYFYSFNPAADSFCAAITKPSVATTGGDSSGGGTTLTGAVHGETGSSSGIGTTTSSTNTAALQNVNTTAISITPNPFRSHLTITGLAITDHVLLYDMMGRSVSIYGNGSTFTVPDAPAGHYVLQVLDDKGSVKARQVVQKL